MRVYALTGGIAAGKSTVIERLRQLGATIIDADVLAREAVAVGSQGLSELVARFGNRILAESGELDRSELARIVFEDDLARRDMNAILHPRIRILGEQRLADLLAANPTAIVIYDIPLLAESGTKASSYDGIIVVTAPESERIRRLIDDRGMTEREARSRVAAQASEEDRLALATYVIDNSREIAETTRQVDSLWKVLVA